VGSVTSAVEAKFMSAIYYLSKLVSLSFFASSWDGILKFADDNLKAPIYLAILSAKFDCWFLSLVCFSEIT